jgi:hypothetical protein
MAEGRRLLRADTAAETEINRTCLRHPEAPTGETKAEDSNRHAGTRHTARVPDAPGEL